MVRRNSNRSGGKGAGESHRSERDRRRLISEKLSMICRHSNDVQRQMDGFIDLDEITRYLNRRGNRHLEASVDDIERVSQRDGGTSKCASNGEETAPANARYAGLRGVSKDQELRLNI